MKKIHELPIPVMVAELGRLESNRDRMILSRSAQIL